MWPAGLRPRNPSHLPSGNTGAAPRPHPYRPRSAAVPEPPEAHRPEALPRRSLRGRRLLRPQAPPTPPPPHARPLRSVIGCQVRGPRPARLWALRSDWRRGRSSACARSGAPGGDPWARGQAEMGEGVSNDPQSLEESWEVQGCRADQGSRVRASSQSIRGYVCPLGG